MNEQHLRIGDAERDEAAAVLADHFAEGRLDAEEHAERLDRVWAARTRGDLAPVFRDLPGRPPHTVAPEPRRSGATAVRAATHRLPAPAVAVLGVLLVLTVVTHLPLVLVVLLVWAHLRGRPHARRHRW